MTNITVDDIMALNPCSDYTKEYVEELWQGKESLSKREILDLDIDIDDRSWVLARLVPTETVVKWAQHCADKAKKYAGLTNKATMAAADAARQAADAADVAAAYADDAAYADAYWAARKAARNAWTAAYEAADAATYLGKDYEETLYSLLEKLVDMTEEN